MSFHRIPVERPRHTKRFLTVRDVEDMSVSGVRQILQTANLVITDAAREIAHDLDITIVSEDRAQPVVAEPIVKAMGVRAPSSPAVSAVSNNIFATQHHDNTASSPLVQELVRTIRTKWRPIKRYPRQLLA